MLCKSEPWTSPHKYISTHSDRLRLPFHRWGRPRPRRSDELPKVTQWGRDNRELKSRTRTVSSLDYTCTIHQQLQGIFFFSEVSRRWIINQSIVLHTKSPKGNSVQDASAFKMQLKCSTFPETDVMVLIILRQARQGSTKRGQHGRKLSHKPDCRMKGPRSRKESLRVHSDV